MTKTHVVSTDSMELDGFERRSTALERKPSGRFAVLFPLDPLPAVGANGWYRSPVQPTTIESGTGYINWRGLIHWRSPSPTLVSVVIAASGFSPPPITSMIVQMMDLSRNRTMAALGADGSLILTNSVVTSSMDLVLDEIRYPDE